MSVVAAPSGYEAAVQVSVPPAPGVSELHDSGVPLWANETKVILPGRVSVSVTVVAASGPALTRVMVKVTSVSGPVDDGPLLLTARSACGGNGVVVTTTAWSFSSFGSISPLTVATLLKAVP